MNLASKPYVCVVDADGILESDGLLRIMAPVVNDPDHVVAAGGIVRVINGSQRQEWQCRRRAAALGISGDDAGGGVPACFSDRQGRVECLQHAADHLRGVWRVSNGPLQADSEAFAGERLEKTWTWWCACTATCASRTRNTAVHFVADPVCWTEVPSTFKSLGNQRARWHNGLIRMPLAQPLYVAQQALRSHWIGGHSLHVVV